MYEDFFRFDARPFPAAPRVDLYFPAFSAENAHQTLIRCIGRAEGPALLIGGTGTGKSLLCHLLAARFQHALHVVMLTSARLCTRRALLQNILFELGLPYRGLQEGELRLSLIDFLKLERSDREGVLLLVDEAHTLPLRLVEEIRMIGNSLHGGLPGVRLVLAGGPALEERLANPKLESLNQRIAARCYLQPLNYEETLDYIRSQIITVGGDPAQVFAEDALGAVHQATDGVPRLVNQLCDHALVLAVVNEQRQVDARLIEEAWADLQQLPAPRQAPASDAFGDEGVIEFGELEETEFEEPSESGAGTVEPIAESESEPSSSYEGVSPLATPDSLESPAGSEAHRTAELESSCDLQTLDQTLNEEIDLARRLEEIETCVAQIDEDATATDELEEDRGSHEGGFSVENPVEATSEAPTVAESPEELPVPHADNPFEEPFGDEEIVVDRYSGRNATGSSVATAASGNQDRELAAAAEAIFQGTEHKPPFADDWEGESATGERCEDTDAAIHADATFSEVIVQADREFEDADHGMEDLGDQDCDACSSVDEADEVDETVSVQASVMRVPPPDDSDLIVVVDEDFDNGQTSSNPGAHRQDYRRLFSRLRQT